MPSRSYHPWARLRHLGANYGGLMGCAGSVESQPPPLEPVKKIDTGVLAKHGALGQLTIIDSKTALVVGQYGVCVLDVSDPNDVRCLTKVKVAGSREFASRITLLPNSTIALVTGSYGVDILDYADPAHTKKVTHIDPGVIDQEARTVIADHRTALVVGAFGVEILDISDPNNVRWLAKVKMGVCTRMSSNRITLIPNSTIAIVTGGDGVATLDYGDPVNTKHVQAMIDTDVLTKSGSGRTTVIDSTTALVVGNRGVCVLNISDPSNVQKLVKIDNTGVLSREHAHTSHHGDGRVTVVGTRAIIVGKEGLAVLDLSEPANAMKVANLMWGETTGKANAKKIGWDYYYVGGPLTLMPDGRYGLIMGGHGPFVIDLLDIDKPVWAHGLSFDLVHDCNPYSTVFIDGYAYVLRGENTVSCLDMRNPASLAHAGELKYDVGYGGGRIYQIAEKHVLIVGGLGVQVMKITPPGEATAMPAATATMPAATAAAMP